MINYITRILKFIGMIPAFLVLYILLSFILVFYMIIEVVVPDKLIHYISIKPLDSVEDIVVGLYEWVLQPVRK